MLFTYVTLILMAQLIDIRTVSSEKSCSLIPLDYGFFYGSQEIPFEEARTCCRNNSLLITAYLPGENRSTESKEMWQSIHDVLLTLPSSQPPIGSSYGVWVRVLNFTFRDMSNSSSEIHQCYEVHFVSPKNLTLILKKVSCNAKRRFICMTDTPYYEPNCDEVKMTTLLGSRYFLSNGSMPWKDAVECCERKGFRLADSRNMEHKFELEMILKHAKLMGHEATKEFRFWLAAHRLVAGGDFIWENSLHIVSPSIDETFHLEEIENCLSGLAKGDSITKKAFRCEYPLPFICEKETSVDLKKKCSEVEFQQLTLPSGVREYWYSVNAKLRWEDAQSCCKENGWNLFKVISVEEGQHIAGALQRNTSTRYRHQGLSHGLWTSGRSTGQNYTFHFVPTPSKISFLEYNNSISTWNNSCNFLVPYRGPLKHPRSLQFVVDTTNSFFLNDAPSSATRSFICDTPIPIDQETGELVELGSTYFYSRVAVKAAVALDMCSSNKMALFQLKNPDENSVLRKVIRNLDVDHSSPQHGIWSYGAPKVSSFNFSLAEQERHKNDSKLAKNEQYPMKKPFHPSANDCDLVYYNKTTNTLQLSKAECETMHHVICERSIDLNANTNAPASEHCTKGKLVEISENLYLSMTMANWTEARRCCLHLGHELLSVDRKEDSKLVYNALAHYNKFFGPNLGVWTSGRSGIIFNQFVWVGSSNFLEKATHFFQDYTNETENVYGDANVCLEAIAEPNLKQKQQLSLSVDWCTKSKYFMCGPKPIAHQVDCSNITFLHMGNSTYFLSNTSATFVRAAECCASRDGYLAPIHGKNLSISLHTYILKHFGLQFETVEKRFWIGLTKNMFKRDRFRWLVSGNPLNATDFQRWEGNNDSNRTMDYHEHNCVAAIAVKKKIEYSWIKVECSTSLKFLCRVL
ncbi:unnamed protein product [Orchesella dallaii]|uniref:C-type lectin domain-containing protein n=1 Tax=Orchesella dallaii TaxID=48710 RepID=A0ABP1PN80_9HEXA